MSKSLTRTSDGQNINCVNLDLTTDIDSFSWTVTGLVVGDDAYNLLSPLSTECIFTVNGEPFSILIESLEPAGVATFGKTKLWNIKGRSQSAKLAFPYQRKITTKFASNTTAAQVASMVISAANTAISDNLSLHWAINDWDIPANVFSVQNLSPVQVIRRLAASVGAYLSTDRNNKILNVRYLYPKNPLTFVDGDQSAVIDDDFVIERGESFVNAPGYNRVIFRGINAGNIVKCTLNGTAGDIEAPVQTDAMILTPQVGRDAGRFYLYENGYKRTDFHYTIPISAQHPIIEPGTVVKINEFVFGIAQSCTIRTTFKSALQQISVRVYQP